VALRKLLRSQLDEIVKRLATGESAKNLAIEFGVTRSYVSLLKAKALDPSRVFKSKPPARKLVPSELAELKILLETTLPVDHGIQERRRPEEWRLEHGFILAEKLFKKKISKATVTQLMAPYVTKRKPYVYSRPTPPVPHHIDQIDPELAKDPDYVAYYLSPICQQIVWREYELAVKDYDERLARQSKPESEPTAPPTISSAPLLGKRTGKHSKSKGSPFTKAKKRK
jgi:hypothetical protein